MFDVSEPLGAMDDFRGGVCDPDDLGDEVVDRQTSAISDVINSAMLLAHGEVGVRRHDVLDVDEVARLLAVAMDGEAVACDGLGCEDRDGGRIGALGILARPKDIEIPEAGRGELSLPREHVAIVFAVELGDGVGALRGRDHRLALGEFGAVPVDGGGRAEAEFFDLGGGGLLQDDQHALVVDLHAFDGGSAWTRAR